LGNWQGGEKMFFLILVIVGIVTIFGVLIIGAFEIRRMGKGQPDIISSILEKDENKAEK
jgi:hypothetical protein